MQVGELLEAAPAQAVEHTLFAPDHNDQRSLPAADERHERGEVELPANAHLVWHRLRQRERPPDVVHRGREDGEPMSTVAAELVGEVGADAVEIGLEALPLVMREG